jgi:hypothetical protein
MQIFQVDFEWEDCSYRIQSLNILLRLSELIENRLDITKKLLDSKMEGKIKHMDVVKNMIDLLDNLSNDLDIVLPVSEFSNTLDKKMRKLRHTEFASVKASLKPMKATLLSMKASLISMKTSLQSAAAMLGSAVSSRNSGESAELAEQVSDQDSLLLTDKQLREEQEERVSVFMGELDRYQAQIKKLCVEVKK